MASVNLAINSLPISSDNSNRSKLDLEPNPFEQSFAVKDEASKLNTGSNTIHNNITTTTNNNNNNNSINNTSDHNQANANTNVNGNGNGNANANANANANVNANANGNINVLAGTHHQTSIDTPGGRRHLLPPVAAITSPSSLLPATPGTGSWMNSLRAGPLSPAMLQGPQQNSASQQQQIATSVSNLSGLTPTSGGSISSFVSTLRRTGLTPGGSGSMFPTPGPATAAILGLTDSNSLLVPAVTDQPIISTSSVPTNRDRQPQRHIQENTHPQPLPQNTITNGLEMSIPANLTAGSATMNGNTYDLNQPNGNLIENINHVENNNNEQTVPAKRGRGRGRKSLEVSKKIKVEGNDSEDSNDDMSNDDDYGVNLEAPQKRANGRRSKLSEEEKRKSFLERNRIAALKCRQRKKQWLADLQTKLEMYTNENESLRAEVNALRSQLVNIKEILLVHKDCPGMHQERVTALLAGGSSSMEPTATTHANMAATSNSTLSAVPVVVPQLNNAVPNPNFAPVNGNVPMDQSIQAAQMQPQGNNFRTVWPA